VADSLPPSVGKQKAVPTEAGHREACFVRGESY